MSRESAFGVLKVAGVDVAVDGSSLEQVVEWPAVIQKYPLGGTAMIGIFCLRGHALPLVDLRGLLGASEPGSDDAPRQIAVVRHKGRRFGMAVDDVADIVKVTDAKVYPLEQPGEGLQLLPKLLLSTAERVVYLLDLDALIAISGVITTSAVDLAAEQRMRTASTKRNQKMMFICGGQRFAIDAEAITELVYQPEIGEATFDSEMCIGIVRYRGVKVPVLNLAHVLGLDMLEVGALDQMLVLTSVDGYRLGFAYDSLLGMQRWSSEEVLPLPSFGLRLPHLFAGVVGSINGEQSLLLDHEALKKDRGLRNFARVYQAETPTENDRDAALENVRHKRACLVFKAPEELSTPLDQIQEIMAVPDAMMQLTAPGQHLLGQFNLRGEQVSMISLSSFLDGSVQPLTELSRVLLVRGEHSLFGLVVGSIESIESFLEDQDKDTSQDAGRKIESDASKPRQRTVNVSNGTRGRYVTMIQMHEVIKALEAPSFRSALAS